MRGPYSRLEAESGGASAAAAFSYRLNHEQPARLMVTASGMTNTSSASSSIPNTRAAVLSGVGSIQPQRSMRPTIARPDKAAIKADNDFPLLARPACCPGKHHMVRVLPLDLPGCGARHRARGSKALHLDGACTTRKVVKLGADASENTRHFDPVSVCLSKGLLAGGLGALRKGRTDR